MARRSLLVLTAAALLFAPGCLSGEEEPVTQGTLEVKDGDASPALGLADGTAAPATSDGVPLWQVGDFWEFQTTGGGQAATTFVVAKSTGSEYLLLPTDEETALYDAVFDVSFVGRTSAKDLSGRQGDTAVKFFQFPLSDNLSWTTTWDGEERTITAKAAQVKTPLGSTAGFDLVARNATGADKVRYSFAPSVGWFTRYEFLEGDEVAYTAELARSGHGFVGSPLQAEARQIVMAHSTTGFTSATSPFTVNEGETRLAVVWGVGGVAAAWSGFLLDGNRTKHDIGGPASYYVNSGAGDVAVIDASPGPWHYSFTYAGAPTVSGFGVILSAVKFTPLQLA